MRNRILVCAVLCALDIAASILLLVWQQNVDVLAWIGMALGVVGALQVCFSYEIAEGGLKCRARFSYRHDARTDFSPSAHLVTLVRVQGWVCCSLPVVFLFFAL